MTTAPRVCLFILLLTAPALAGCLDPGSAWSCPTDPCKVRGVQATLGFQGPRDDAAVHDVAARLGYTENMTGGEGSALVFHGHHPDGALLKVRFVRTLDEGASPPTATFLVIVDRLDPAGPKNVTPEAMGAYLADRRQAERSEMEAFWAAFENTLEWELGSGPQWAPLYVHENRSLSPPPLRGGAWYVSNETNQTEGPDAAADGTR